MITEYIVEQIRNIKKSKPLLIAFDGVDTSGKTTLANKVFASMKEKGFLHPIRVQIDTFHNPKEIRKQKGELSPEGFFYDSFNYSAIFDHVISPVKKGAKYITAGLYDYKTEKEIEKTEIPICKNSVILFDGIFMNRDELYGNWDLSIFLDITFDTVIKRALVRDMELFGSEEKIKERYISKYIPGEKIYMELCKPEERADIVIENSNYDAPVILKKMNHGE